MDYRLFVEKAVRAAVKKGADAAEVYLETGRDLSVEVRNGDVETVQEAASQGVGVRVFVRGAMAFAHSNDVSEAACNSALDRAVDMARITTPDEYNVLPAPADAGTVEGLYDPGIAAVPLEKKIAMTVSLEKQAMADARITRSAGASFGESGRQIYIANTHGLVQVCREGACFLGVSVVAEKGEQKCDGAEYCGRRFFADLAPEREIAAAAAEKAWSMLDPRPVRTQRAPVIVHPDAAGSILGGVLAAVNGNQVVQGASFLGDKLDQPIMSALVTLIDDGRRPKGLASLPFDGEGVPTQRRVIVENGVLKGFMYNTMVAARAGTASTGNASRGGFSSLPGIGSHNFYMQAGTVSADDIIRSTKRGLVLREVTGYGINPVNGNFSGGASGFWVENGRISFPVKGLTIAGAAGDMLTGIDMVADDLDLNRTFTAPTFRIREMQIGGE
ncbi:TldD/PmbA family protein [bacterium]|nr:TldD/PmbA family protein [bacterium]